jgi:hypothetical protein
MTPTTTPQFGPDFVKELIPWVFARVGEETAKAFRMIWDTGMAYLAEHWIAVIVVLVTMFLIALVRAFVTGRWAMLGSITYNYLYFGTLFIIGLIFGPELFANDYFKIFLAVLYVTCFILTGKFLQKIGVRRF